MPCGRLSWLLVRFWAQVNIVVGWLVGYFAAGLMLDTLKNFRLRFVSGFYFDFSHMLLCTHLYLTAVAAPEISFWEAPIPIAYTVDIAQAEPVEAPPVPRGRGGGVTYAQGPHVTWSCMLLVNRPKKNVYIFRKCAPHQKHFSAQNALNIVRRPGFARTRWGSLQRSPDP